MRANSDRWVEVTPSRHAHERVGLDYVRERLPDADPYRAWSNLEVVTPRGESLEVDLLVLGPAGLYLVELKSWTGRIRGNSYQWVREDRRRTVVDNPFISANHKARILKSQLLESYRRSVRPGRGIPPAEDFVPWVQAAVFLSHQEVVCQFESNDRMQVYGVEEASDTTRLPGLLSGLIMAEPRDPQDRIDPERSHALGSLLRRAGMGRRRQRRIGPYTLDAEPFDSGPGWQDWLATHFRFRDERHRVRIYYVGGSTSAEDRALLERAAEREYRLLQHVDNPGLVAPQEYHDSDLGPALVYPYEPEAQRLDHLVAGGEARLDIGTQLGIVRGLAETLRYAHGRRITHRALSPRCVHVELGAEGPVVRIADWQTGARLAASRSGEPSVLAGTLHVTELVDAPAQAYRAPDRPARGTADEVRLDVFGLGAVSYFIVCGRPPASDAVVLTQRLQADDGLDISGDLDSPVEELRSLVLDATRGRVDERLPTMEAFLERLAEVERALSPPEELPSPEDVDPLEAGLDTEIGGRWRVVRRLGAGSSAVALLVEDLAEGEAPCVLKVARDEDRAPRLREEAEALRQLDDERIARLRSDGVLVVGGRTAVALEYAGDQTLASYLRQTGRLTLDRLERWGEDLLAVAAYLDSAGVNHRDIKPDNLGIRERPRDRQAHLVLFDFSLAGTSTAVLEAGTPPYLDPFLGKSSSRHRWDAAAERYAVAVTLFEMATGHTPVYGDGVSNPQLVEAEATIDPGWFDPAVAPHLVPFFERALRRRADERFDTFQEMQRAWRDVFEAAASEAAKGRDADDLTARATRSTPLGESGLSPRAISALEPLGLVTVGDLVGVPAHRLNRLGGVNEATRREIRSRARQWRERLAGEPAAAWEPWQPGDQRLFRPRSIDGVIEQLVPPSRGRNATEVAAARLLLGQDRGARSAPGWLTQAELAELLGVTRVRAQQLDAGLRARWSRSGDDNPLGPVRDDLVEILTSLGGVGTASEAAQALLALRGSTAEEPARTAQAVGLVRAAVEAELERGGEARLGRARRGDVVWIAIESRLGEQRPTAEQLVDYAAALGRAASALPAEDDAPVAPGVATQRLRAVPSPPGMLPVTDGRLLRVAAAAGNLAVSPRDELYPRGMSAPAALRHSGAGFPAPNAQPSVENLQERVRARFPEAEALPGRPELDDLLAEISSPLRWDPAEARYRSRTATSTSLPTAAPGRTVDGHEGEADPGAELDRRVRDAITRRAFLAIGVSPGRFEEERRALGARYQLVEVDVAQALMTRMRELISGTELTWDAVLTADAADSHSLEGEGLRNLVGASVGAVEDAIRAAAGPVLLTRPGLLARYEHLDLIARLADHTTTHPHAVVLLVPAEGGATPTVDRQPLPVLGPMQWMRAPSRATARAAVEEGAR